MVEGPKKTFNQGQTFDFEDQENKQVLVNTVAADDNEFTIVKKSSRKKKEETKQTQPPNTDSGFGFANSRMKNFKRLA